MKKPVYFLSILLFALSLNGNAQPPVLKSLPEHNVRKDELTRYYLKPQRIVWTSDTTGTKIRNLDVLLKPGEEQAAFHI
ncbi:MAG TPA: hypothetical protein VKA27_13120, partial [Sunxiuqinia sp.]|nr:hypothetical protein [Sunxiuqinia sp.]